MMRGLNIGILSYGLSYYDHLGASCSNIGRIRTKENIAVRTLLIGNAKATGGYMIVFES